MGRHQSRPTAQSHVVALGGAARQDKLMEHVRATKVAKDDVTGNVGNARRR